jgi:hypothetical protein
VLGNAVEGKRKGKTANKELDGQCSMHGRFENGYKISVGKPEGQTPLGRRWRWDNIKIDLTEYGVSV